MPLLNEGNTAGDFVLYEADDHYSIDLGTVASGADLEAGTVLGLVTASGKYSAHDAGASDGSETAVAVLREDAAAADADVTNVRVVARHARLNRLGLKWGSGVTTAQHRTDAIADLKAQGILVTDAH